MPKYLQEMHILRDVLDKMVIKEENGHHHGLQIMVIILFIVIGVHGQYIGLDLKMNIENNYNKWLIFQNPK